MAKAKARRRAKMTVPLAIVGGFAPLAIDTIVTLQDPNQGIREVPHVMAYHLAGYNTWDKTFSMTRLISGWTPIIAGFMAHKLAGRFGINRAIARAGIPLVRI